MTESPSSQYLGSTYILDEQIGSGAQGEVWKGHSKDSPRPLAFKVLHKSITAESSVIDAFLKERSALKRAAGPNVIEVHDIVVERNTLGLVMDYVDGGSLRDTIKSRGALPPQEVAWLGAQISAGIAAVHNAGVVHRDIKPENILMDSSTSPETPKIVDFGVASICDSAVLTRTAVGAGTPLYMAPEVNGGARPSFAMDVYSLGIILYELSCGVTPFSGTYNYVIAAQILMAPVRPEGIPDSLWDLISKMLDKNPTARPSINEAQHALKYLSIALSGIPAAPTLSSSPCAPDSSPPPAPPHKSPAPPQKNAAPAPQIPQTPEVAETITTLSPPAPPPQPGTQPAYPRYPERRAPAPPPPPRPHKRSSSLPIAVATVSILAIAGSVGASAYIYTHLSHNGVGATGAASQEGVGAPADGDGVANDRSTVATSFVESLKQSDETSIWRQTTPQARQQLEDPSPAAGYQTARDYIVHNASAGYSINTCMNNADATAAGIQVAENQVACRIDFSCQASCPTPFVVLEAEGNKVDSISFIDR